MEQYRFEDIEGRRARSPSATGPTPLFVGVTGHRNLVPDDVYDLERIVRDLLEGLAREYPHTRMIVLSPLAEGADRIVARAALQLGLELIAPLPMPPAAYVTDFTSPASIDEFWRLKAAASRDFVVPCHATNSVRENRYEALSAYMVDASDILIALWDGESSARIGGTAKTVEFQLSGLPERYDPDNSGLDPPDTGPVYHVVTPRRGRPRPRNALGVNVLGPAVSARTSGDRAYKAAFSRIDSFNAEALRDRDVSVPCDEDTCYRLADRLAVRYGHRTRAVLNAIFISIAVAVMAFEVVAHLHWSRSWLLVDILGFACAFAVFAVVRRLQIESKYQDYRALAEAFRVQRFWHRIGLNDGVADYYLRKQRGELAWIRKALQSSCRLMRMYGLDGTSRVPTVETLRDVADEWVRPELKFFQRLSQSEQDRRLSSNWLAGCLVIVALVLAAKAIAIRDPDVQWNGHTHLEWLLFASAALALIGALLHNYSEKRAWSQQAREYERMRAIYANADISLKRMLAHHDGGIVAAVRLFRDLGRESLTETADWLLTHRDRPIDIPGP